MQRFVRDSPSAEWRPIGEAFPVSLGRAGLAWGLGQHEKINDQARHKREGDGCAPAGIFALTELFGVAPTDSPFARTARLPYRCTGSDLKAIDDPTSRYYNRIVDQRQITRPDWHSHEEMWRADERYTIGAVIAHNAAPPLPGAGSCIFFHVWQAPGMPTAGCTAGAPADVETICGWLDGAAAPLLVQLPQAEYRQYKTRWALP